MADYKSNSTEDQKNNTIPGSTTRNYNKRSSLDLLPEYYQTDTNKKFLNATLDPLIQSGQAEKKSGYIGKKIGKIRSSVDDAYLVSKTTNNNRYQLEPSVVSQNISTGDYESTYTYDDIIEKLKYLGASTTNLDKLFSDYNYSWRPPIDVDMLINWNSYVWLPYGLPIFGLHGTSAADVEGLAQFTSGVQTEYGNRTIKLENGMRLTFSNDNNVYLVTGVGSKIKLIVESTFNATTTTWESNLTSITPYAHGVANQTMATGTVTTSNQQVNSISISAGATQGTGYVYKPFFNIYDSSGGDPTHAIASGSIGTDGKVSTTITATTGGDYGASAGVHLLVVGGQKVTPFKNGQNTDVHWSHEYLTMERGARDNNAWSRSNNWYHIDTIKAVNAFIGVAPTFKIGDSVASPSSSITLGQTLDDSDYAQRPIICWEKDLRLYNHGIESRKPVAMVISTLSDPGSDLASNLVHNGYTVQIGDRVLIINATTPINNQICTVGTGYSLSAITNDNGRSTASPNHGDVVTVMNGPTEYNINRSYSINDIIKFGELYYKSYADNNQGHEPGTDTSKWQTISTVSLYRGVDYKYNAETNTWEQSQPKEKSNIHPLFELYDRLHKPLTSYNQTDFEGSTVFEYKTDTTSATRTADDYLGFPLSYTSSSYISKTNTGNLVFNNSITQTIYQYNRFTTPVDINGFYYLQKYDVNDGKHYFDNCWHKSYKQIRTPITVTQEVTSATADLSVDLGTTNYEPERDFWLRANTTGWEFHLDSAYGYEKLTGINPTLYLARGKTYTFDVTNGTTSLAFQNKAGSSFTSGISTSGTKTTFAVDASETNSILYYTGPGSSTGKIIILDEILEQGWPEVFHNGNKLLRNVHYTFNGQNVVVPYKTGNSSYAQAISNDEDILAVGDIVDVKFYTTDTSGTNEWAYDVPNQLKNNPNNKEIKEIQYSEFLNHFVDVIEKQPGNTGSSFGSNNYRNLDKAKWFGGTINQQLSSLLKTGLSLSNEDYDLLLALEYIADSYSVFKKKFVQKIEQIYNSNTTNLTTSGIIDQALYDINLGKNNTFPFANSDMMYYFNLVEKTYSVSSSTSNFNLPKNITRTNQYKNHVYVYTIDTNGVETYLTSDLYTLDTTSTTNKITLNNAVSSGKVVIKVSIDEGLSFIPPTLAKLGIIPCVKPTYYLDNTGSRQVVVLEGHDGSKTVSFNTTVDSNLTPSLTDVRDKALFELENRIYDNIISTFKNTRKDLSYIPGKYRTTPYTRTEQNNFYDNYFNSYKIKRGITELTNSSYDANNKFTHNYSSTQPEGIGYWRGIYKYYFDTDRPHTHPWEMLGFVEKPSWWDAGYGSPTTTTTNDNCWANATKKTALESALQKGIISEPGQAVVQDINVARPGATFPVTGTGTAGGTDATVTLQDPDTWSLTSPTANEAKAAFKFGDGGAIETVWNRSSLFPYIENKFLFISKPAEYVEKYYDVLDRINDGPDYDIKTFKVVVASDGTQNRFYIDGIPRNTLTLEQGKTYIFDQSDSSNAGSLTYTSNHPLYFTTIMDTEGSIYSQGTQQVWKIGSTDYTTFAGSSNYEQSFKSSNTGDRYTKLTIPKGTTISQLFYSCGNHSGMGGAVEIVDSKHESQKISKKTKKRHNTDELYIHNEIDETNLTRRTVGIQQPIVDRLMFLGNSVYKDFARQLRQLNVKQAYKLQGYSKNNNISLLADSLKSELSDNFIPNDNIQLVLHKSAPYKNLVYSGVEIVKTKNGYKVYGWNNSEPYFNTLSSIKVSGRTFSISKTNLIRYTNYNTDITKVYYGTEFPNIQDVYWFFLEYEKYLESVGFEFNDVDSNNNQQNWNFAANQFVIWAESNWDVNTSIMLSPAGNNLYLTLDHGYVKDNQDEYGSFYLDKDKKILNLSQISVDRQYGYVSVKPKGDLAIYCASIVVCDYEHLMVLDNATIFNDIIYEPMIGEEKLRLKLDSLNTSNWNGTLYAPGYIVSDNSIFENFDKSAANVGRGLFDENQTILDPNLSSIARKNIGYEKKQFLRNMRLSDDVQFQFMKGLLHKKGTPDSFNRLIRSTFLLESSVDIDLEEEWMFRLGEFGPTGSQTTKEFTLKKSDIKRQPQLIDFAGAPGQGADIPSDAIISMLRGDSRWLEEPATDPPVQFTTRAIFDQDLSSFDEIETYEGDLPNAGYPRLNEVTYTIFNKNDLPTIYNNYKDDKTSLVYKLLDTEPWRDTYSYAVGSFVRHKGKRWQNSVSTTNRNSFKGINNLAKTTYHSTTVFTAWSNSTSYGIGAYVSYGGNNYRSITGGSNKQPDTNTNDWSLVGIAGGSHNNFGTWNANFAYEGTDDFPTNPDYVVYQGAEYKAIETSGNVGQNPSAANSTFWVKTGDLFVSGLQIDKCVFSYDNTTKLTATTYPFSASILGVEARLGEFNTVYYPIQSVDSTNTKADSNGDFTMVFSFAPNTVSYANLPADDDAIYISAFQYRASSGDDAPWTAVVEDGLFTTWIAQDDTTNSWDVMSLQDGSYDVELVCPGYVTGDEALVKLNGAHNLSVGDYVFIVGAQHTEGLNGIHKVTGLPTGSDCDTCGNRSVKQFYIDQYIAVNEQYCKCFIFRSSRFINTTALFNALTDVKYNWLNGWYAYVDNYYKTQALAIAERTQQYTLSNTITSANDIQIYFGANRTLLPATSGSTTNWSVSGQTLTFNSGVISGWRTTTAIVVFSNVSTGYAVYSYNSTNVEWDFQRTQQTKANPNQLANILVYDYAKNIEISRAEVWDPYKGIIPGIAEVEIDFNTTYDMALYSSTTDQTKNVTTERYWNKEQIGTTWWNLKTLKYLEYEQKQDLTYSYENWGGKFPGSSVDVYEWTKSTVTPDEWASLVNGEFVIDGEVASGEAYYKIINDQTYYYWSEDTEYDPYTAQEVTYYYFWVKNKITVPITKPDRELSTLEIARYINDPTGSGIFWASPLGLSSIISGNLDKAVISDQSVFQVNFKNESDYEHKEWITLRENDSAVVHQRFVDRLHESLLGFDKNISELKLIGTESTGSNINTIAYDWNSEKNYPAYSVVIQGGNLQNNIYKVDLESSRLKLSLPTIADYASGTTYAKDDVVNDATNKIQYISLADNNTGNVLTSTSHWAKHYPEIRVENLGTSLVFGATVTIDPPVGNSLGLPLEDISAYAFPNIVGGAIDSITIVRGGRGYQSKPNVYISYPEGTGGTRATVIDADVTLTNGEVTAITMNAARKGSGYVQTHLKIGNEVLEAKYFDEYATRKFSNDVNYLDNAGFESNTGTNWSTQSATLNITSTSGEVISGLYSGKVTISSGTTVAYVGQRGIDTTLAGFSGIDAGVKYRARITFRSTSSLSNSSGVAILSYGHSSSAQTTFSGFTVTSGDTASLNDIIANETHILEFEFTASSDRYQAIFLKFDIPSQGSDVYIFVDDIEYVNISSGDRIKVVRGVNHPVTTSASSIAAHNQYDNVTEIGVFNRQSWTVLKTGTYEYVNDNTIKFDNPNEVPSLRLNEIFRYGGQIRPYKQSWIKNRLKAIRVLVQKANELLLKINLSDSQLNWRKRLGGTFDIGDTSYTPSDYWEYADWFHPNYTINSSTVAQQTVNTRNELYDVNTSLYTTVRVDDDDGAGAWAFYQWVSNQWLKIGKQNGTIQLLVILYDVKPVDGGWDSAEWDIAGWDKNYNNEFQNVLEALHQDIFVGSYKSFYKELFFAMIKYIYSEQNNLDWVAKSSILQLTRSTPLLLQPKTFDVGSEEDILEYLNETKPYHSKIETIADTRTIIEESKTTATEVLDIRVQTNAASTSGTVTAGPLYDVSTEEDDCRGITFNNDGTKMFIVGTTGDDVNEYTLSSGFDLTSTVNHVGSYAVTQCPNPTAVKFNADGSKMFVTGVGNNNVHEYALGTDFTVSSASFTRTLVTTVDNNNFGLDFKPDGTKMYITGDSNNKIYEFDLSTGFDISTATFNQDLNVGAQDIEPFGIEWSPDGKKLFIVGTKGNGVDLYKLSTAWDISTATWVEFYFIGGNPSGIHISPAGTKMFIIGNDTNDPTNGNKVKSYTLSHAYTFTDTSSTSTTDSRAFRIFITDAGTRKYEGIIDANKTTLTSAITATATEIDVASASAVKETGNTGTIVIGSERITFTGVSTNKLTGCTRGVDGTTPQAHANSASVVKAGTDMNLTLATDPLGYPAFNPTAGTSVAGVGTLQGLNVTQGTI